MRHGLVVLMIVLVVPLTTFGVFGSGGDAGGGSPSDPPPIFPHAAAIPWGVVLLALLCLAVVTLAAPFLLDNRGGRDERGEPSVKDEPRELDPTAPLVTYQAVADDLCLRPKMRATLEAATAADLARKHRKEWALRVARTVRARVLRVGRRSR